MGTYTPLARYESAAATARVREQLAGVRDVMWEKAVLDVGIARLAAKLDLRPAEAIGRLEEMARHGGMSLVEAARRVETPPPDDSPLPELPGWVQPMLETFHVTASYLTPITDSVGRLVDFRVAAMNSHGTTPDGRTPASVLGTRALLVSPAIGSSGLHDRYISSYETGVPFSRPPAEHVEIAGDHIFPVLMSVRTARVADGLLMSWLVHDDQDMLVSGWGRAQRLAGLGWGEWNLATGQVIWTPEMYEIFGREPYEEPVALEDVPGMVVPEDLATVADVVDSLL
ncbi:hypothetical protein ACFQ07_24400, partial [Actinomadura adrarensis]